MMYIMKEVIDIEDFLEYQVDDIMWLRVLSGRVPITELIDKEAFKDFLKSENDQYCNANGLCEECRSPLERFPTYEEVCGSRRLVEVEYRCPHGCN